MDISREASHQSAAPSTGTTIVSCSFKGGVVLGCDGRVSVGNYISNRASNKLAPLADNIFMLRSGSAPDTQIISDNVGFFLKQMVAESGEEPTVEVAAKLVSMINYQNKDHLVGAIIVAGWDKHKGGQVFGCPISGTLVSEKWAIDGSGSTYIWAYCDSEFREDFTREEALHFVTEAIALAMTRDSSSGGCIRTVTCTAEGAVHGYIPGNEVPQFIEDLPFPASGAGGMMLG